MEATLTHASPGANSKHSKTRGSKVETMLGRAKKELKGKENTSRGNTNKDRFTCTSNYMQRAAATLKETEFV